MALINSYHPMNYHLIIFFKAFLTICFVGFVNGATASELVINGDFENNGGVGTQTFTGWTVFNQVGGAGSVYVQTGTAAPPPNALVVSAPPLGNFAAMTAQSGPGSHILYQDIAIPAGVTASFSARVEVRSSAPLSTKASLDYTVANNQQARVDIMNPAAPLQDVGAGVLLNVFQTTTGGPQNQPYTTITANLTPFAGTTVRLRFAETDNMSNMSFGIDGVSVQIPTIAPTSIPTLSEWGLVGLALFVAMFGMASTRRRL